MILDDDEFTDLVRLVRSLPDDVDNAGREHGPTLTELNHRFEVRVGDLWHVRGDARVASAFAACAERRARQAPKR